MLTFLRSFVGQPASRDYWSRLEHFNPAWGKRAALAASLIAPDSSVIDIGCGRMQLRDHLPDSCRYSPADLTQWTAEVQKIDLDAGQFPKGTYNYCVILGVLEYLEAPGNTLGWARSTCDHLIVSYCHPLSRVSNRSRRRRMWVNDFSETDFCNLLCDAGWHPRTSYVYETSRRHRQIVYSCMRANAVA